MFGNKVPVCLTPTERAIFKKHRISQCDHNNKTMWKLYTTPIHIWEMLPVVKTSSSHSDWTGSPDVSYMAKRCGTILMGFPKFHESVISEVL